jgi:hypothetical protein
MSFKITSDGLIDYTLALQKLNDVALPFAVQETLNETVKDVKKRTLKLVTESEFDIKRKSFFKSNSAHKPGNAKEAGYNINKMHAEVGITKGTKAREKSTEQIGNQETATPIDRSINPLGNKPQKQNVIDILSKRPEFIEYDKNDDSAPYHYMRAAARAKKRGAALVIGRTGRTGAVNIVNNFQRIYGPKKAGDRKKYDIQLKNIASYHKSGEVKLKTKHPFLTNSLLKSANEVMDAAFIKAAERQIARYWKR